MMYLGMGQMVHAILILLLLSGGSASSSEQDDDDDEELERRLRRFDLHAQYRKPFRNHPPYGENEFLLVLAGNHTPYESFPERMARIRRSFNNLDCANTDAPGQNDFESGTFAPNGFLEAFDSLGVDERSVRPEDIDIDRTVAYDPKECFEPDVFKIYDEFERKSKSKGKKKKLKKKKDPEQSVTSFKKGKTYCGLDLSKERIGASCCLYWAKLDISFCIGIGFIFEDMEAEIKATVEDFTLFRWAKSFKNSKLAKFLRLFSKSFCVPHKFRWALTVCLQLSLDLNPVFKKGKKSSISLCPAIIAQLFVFYDISLIDLPCWTWYFKIPFINRQGYLPDVHNYTPTAPVENMWAIENLADAEDVATNLTARGEEEYQKLVKANPGAVIRQNTNEPPRVLKKGTPTVPVNWEVTEITKLNYLVVLYTIPLASPTKNDTTKIESQVDSLKNITADSMDRRKTDPSYINLKVIASMGRSCGGIIISPNKILTLCDCVEYFYLYHKYGLKEAKKVIKDVFTLEAKDIYVTYANKKFQADQIEFELDHNIETFMKKSHCIDAIERYRQNKVDNNQEPYGLVMAMTITRTFPQPNVLKMAVWGGIKGTPINVKLTGIGFRKRRKEDLFDKTGLEFDPLYEVLNIPFVSCPKTSFCQQGAGWKDSRQFDEETQCFCAVNQNFQLCDGVIGFPVLSQTGEAIGLNSLSMHCKAEGSMVTAVFSAKELKEIDDYIKGVDYSPALSGSLLLITAFFAILQST